MVLACGNKRGRPQAPNVFVKQLLFRYLDQPSFHHVARQVKTPSFHQSQLELEVAIADGFPVPMYSALAEKVSKAEQNKTIIVSEFLFDIV